jgi:hypothetical protein
VAAREDQPEPVVRDPAHVDLVTSERLELGKAREGLGLLPECPLAPKAIDRSVPRRGRDPGRGVVRDPAVRPGPQRFGEGFLNGVLRQVEVADDADQGRNCPPLLAAEQAVGDPAGVVPFDYIPSGYSVTGRISIDPYGAAGILDAASIAWSRFSHSTM